MNRDIESLLALQNDDTEIRKLERRIKALEPRLLDLDRARQVAADALDRARHALESEERKQHDLQHRVAEHRTLHERNLSQLDQVRKMREATAAMSQVEQARRVLADEEAMVQQLTRRVVDLRQAVTAQEQAVEELDAEQAEQRGKLAEERTAIQKELDAAIEKRGEKAAKVPRAVLTKYDRIAARRHDDAVFPLRGPSCGNCDTAIPLQRRNVMVANGTIELCEACGVLLYAPESTATVA